MTAKFKHNIVFYIALLFSLITILIFCDAMFSKHLSYTLPFVSYGGTFKWKYLQIGTIKLSLYWTAHIIGILLMCVICFKRKHLCKLTGAKAIMTGILLAVFGFIGAKILFIIENIHFIIENNIEIGLGGVSFFGTVFFMPLIIPVLGKIMKVNPLSYLDYCTPAGIIMLACIRCGCFMRGCCHGITVWAALNPLIFPTQLIECTLDLFLLAFILKLESSQKFNNGRYILFMGYYGIIRFIVEFLRDTPKNKWLLSNGQIFSLICIFILITYLVLRRRSVK